MSVVLWVEMRRLRLPMAIGAWCCDVVGNGVVCIFNLINFQPYITTYTTQTVRIHYNRLQ
jgi:hypothetical protein